MGWFWRPGSQPDGSYELRSVESGLCADVDGGATTAGAAIIQWACTCRYQPALDRQGNRWWLHLRLGQERTGAHHGVHIGRFTGDPAGETGSALQCWTVT
ncbi:RICIN domain-containing protein [Amycolatopsis sp. H20-H5]|uniref:RICIN domain-containing protein n=1 Tax=Amycolatopsis sp. H20-H5 TaxID=3046309 RepID=UPI002DBEEB9F|nr:RICIN domain-containing protein [Amycolatopsis sp. H20-H5]MEC3974358.1 RICIN domain-containing protein [Amycolatopsis sp. H20-H5]